MPRPRLHAAALHIGVGRPRGLPMLRYPDDAVPRAAQISLIAGIGYQVVLFDGEATMDAVVAHVKAFGARLAPDGLFVMSFAGHGKRRPDTTGEEPDGLDEAWHLYDAPLFDDELRPLLARFPPRSRIVLVGESCYSGGMKARMLARALQPRHLRALLDRALMPLAPFAPFAPFRPIQPCRPIRPRVALISRGGELQTIIDTPSSVLCPLIEKTVFPDGHRDEHCTYQRLAAALDGATPEFDKAAVWWNREEVAALQPFA
jgi:hypothetical protein